MKIEDTTKAIENWFASKIATGDIALDTVAYNHAVAAKNDLIARFAASDENDDPAVIVGHWYPQQLVCGMLGRNAAGSQQAEDAKADLISALTPSPAPAKPVSPPPPPQQPAADAATKE